MAPDRSRPPPTGRRSGGCAVSVDLSFLSVVRDGEDDYVIGNGETFANVPEIAAAVVGLLDGTRSAQEVREHVMRTRGVDVDVADFVSGLDGIGLLAVPERPPNLWDRIQRHHVAWLFSRPADVVVLLLTGCAVAALILRPDVAPTYSGVIWSGSSLVFTASFAAGSWLLVLMHELSHIAAARSLGVRAGLSLGARSRFLVVQTDVTGVWRSPRRARQRVYLAGMRTDLAIFSAAVCVAAITGDQAIAGLSRMAALICLSQIVWQFLFFMKTDVYYAYANLSGDKDLMAAARAHLASGRTSAAPPSVRIYAWFVAAGRVVGLAFLALYTVPLTAAVCDRALAELSLVASPPDIVSPAGTLLVIGLGWAWYLYVWLVRGTRVRRAGRRRAR
ncbi:hypothetical protein [Streptosporangium sp. KLBMP 9127]|nr:hypothetical protein [Streptosporangium sp. KLBMP 9127]